MRARMFDVLESYCPFSYPCQLIEKCLRYSDRMFKKAPFHPPAPSAPRRAAFRVHPPAPRRAKTRCFRVHPPAPRRAKTRCFPRRGRSFVKGRGYHSHPPDPRLPRQAWSRAEYVEARIVMRLSSESWNIGDTKLAGFFNILLVIVTDGRQSHPLRLP